MKNKSWPQMDIDYLVANYKLLNIKKLAVKFDRTINSIRLKAKELKLSSSKNLAYSKANDKYIISNIDSKTIQEIADELGRTKSAINKRLLFLRKGRIRGFNKSYAVIEDGIKINDNISEQLCLTLNKLNTNQSFVFDKKHYVQLLVECKLLRPKRFRTKTVDENTSRVWRVF